MLIRTRRTTLAFLILLLVVGASAAGVRPPDHFGGGEAPLPLIADHITDENRARIQAAIDANIAMLREEGLLLADRTAESAPSVVQFGWPLAPWSGLADPGYHGISGFVDQDPAFPGVLLDYNCGARTYDLDSGYNHQGVDFFTWPWGWLKMDHDQVAVVAAAPGQIVYRETENPDRSCGFLGGNWNAVYVQNSDGSITWYGHMKKRSVTQKGIGQPVAAGEYLGIVGSSGNSTGPHLHMETRDVLGNLVEPYDGPCNVMNPGTSWWAAQRPYRDSALNALTTGGAQAVPFPACPTQENPNIRTEFALNDPIWFTTYYRDQLAGQTSTMTVYRPDGTVWNSWAHTPTGGPYSRSLWDWMWDPFPGTQTGTWRFEVEYLGQTHSTEFSLGAFTPGGRIDPTPTDGLRMERIAGGALRLTWGASCLASDTDYAVYQGRISDGFESHTPRTCAVGGTTHVLAAPSWDTYYLVVPQTTVREGSHGRNAFGAERSQGPAACQGQLVAVTCP